jgi:hypothetical protein
MYGLISPLPRAGRDEKTASAMNDDLPPPGRDGVRSLVVPGCQRPVHLKRTPGRTPAHHAIDLFTLWTARLAKKHRAPKEDAAVSAERAFSTRAFGKVAAAARKEQFGAKPGSVA